MTEPPYPVLTTELLQWSIPATAKKWWLDRKQGDVWQAMSWSEPGGMGGSKRKYFEVDETLTVETLRERWGEGTFRLNWCSARSRHKFSSPPFVVPPADPTVAQPAPTAEPAPTAPMPTNGNGNGAPAAFRAGMPTAQHAPPLLPTDVRNWVGTRDHSPMELMLAIRQLCNSDMQMHLRHEERRSNEHREEMRLRQLTITEDAKVRVAEANARASWDRDRAHETNAEVAQLRATLLEAARAGNNPENPDMLEAIDELRECLDGLDLEEEPSVVAQMIGSIIGEFIPVLKHALARKIAPNAIEDGAGSMADTISEVTGAGGEGS